ncbi:MAG: PP2C family protein-serine/threonine phosphatase, partial [Sporomusa sp.]
MKKLGVRKQKKIEISPWMLTRQDEPFESGISEAKQMQLSLLPKPLKNKYIAVDIIYSPFGQVSGDFLDYWWCNKEKILYGYVLDATGHNIAAAMQVCALRIMFCQTGKCGLNLTQKLAYINSNMLTHQHNFRAVAIMFAVNCRNRTIQYAAAGISPFFIRQNNGVLQAIKTVGYPLGYKLSPEYELKTESFAGATEIIFASDGFSDLLNNKVRMSYKHDDAS